VAMKGSNQYILMILHLEGTSVLYSTLHCLIKYGFDKIADYSSTLSKNAMSWRFGFFHNWPVPPTPLWFKFNTIFRPFAIFIFQNRSTPGSMGVCLATRL